MSTQEGSSRLVGSLLEFAVRLHGYDLGAQFVNPLSLHWNGVVDETWICEPGVKIGITESSFSYTNGVNIEATGEELLFRGSRLSSSQESALALQAAKKYTSSFGVGNVAGVSLEFTVRIRERTNTPDVPDPIDSLVYPGLLRRLNIEGVQPAVGSTVAYAYPDRVTRVELVMDSNLDPLGIQCNGIVYRDLAEPAEEAQGQLQSIFENWRSDWTEVLSTASQLLGAYPGDGEQT